MGVGFQRSTRDECEEPTLQSWRLLEREQAQAHLVVEQVQLDETSDGFCRHSAARHQTTVDVRRQCRRFRRAGIVELHHGKVDRLTRGDKHGGAMLVIGRRVELVAGRVVGDFEIVRHDGMRASLDGAPTASASPVQLLCRAISRQSQLR